MNNNNSSFQIWIFSLYYQQRIPDGWKANISTSLNNSHITNINKTIPISKQLSSNRVASLLSHLPSSIFRCNVRICYSIFQPTYSCFVFYPSTSNCSIRYCSGLMSNHRRLSIQSSVIHWIQSPLNQRFSATGLELGPNDHIPESES